MKLQSMTDFVLEQSKKDLSAETTANNCISYAKFLKQPLKLEMFVSDDKEKVLFEGCSTMQQGENTIVIFNHTGIWYVWENKTIEDLIKENLILTTNATKQFL